MGDFTASLLASAGSEGVSAVVAGAGAWGAGACAWMTWGAAATCGELRLIRTASSPSFISISATSEASRSSMSFFDFSDIH